MKFSFFKSEAEEERILPKKTADLMRELSNTADMSKYLERNKEEFITKDFLTTLKELTERKGIDKSKLTVRSGLDRYYVYEIYRGRKMPSADKIICIALALELTLEECQYLLISASRPTLYVKKKRDSIIIFALNNKKTVMETNALLLSAGEPLLVEV